MTNRISFAVAVGLLLMACSPSHPTSDAIDRFEENAPDSVSFYALHFYPSTIRVISRLPGEEFADGFSEVKRARVLLAAGQAGQGLTDRFDVLRQELEAEDYESLMKLKSRGSRVEIFLSDRGSTPHYIVMYSDEAASFILEMIGEVSVNTLRDLGTMDTQKVMDFFDIRPVETDTSTVDTTRTTHSVKIQIKG